jgi:hypothetical protein
MPATLRQAEQNLRQNQGLYTTGALAFRDFIIRVQRVIVPKPK